MVEVVGEVSAKELAVLAIGGFGAMQKVDELQALLSLLSVHHPAKVLEIGVGKAGVTWALSKLSSVQEIVSIDLPNGPWGGGPDAKTLEYIRGNTNAVHHYLAADSRLPSSISWAAGFGMFDFLMIDGDHSYEGVKADYENYKSLVKPGGLIAFHDICPHPAETKCEVEKFWKELIGTGVEFMIAEHEPRNWGGIGVIRVP